MLHSAQGHDLDGMAGLAIALVGIALLGFAIPLAWLVSGPALVALGMAVVRSPAGAPLRVLGLASLVLGVLIIGVFVLVWAAFLPA